MLNSRETRDYGYVNINYFMYKVKGYDNQGYKTLDID